MHGIVPRPTAQEFMTPSYHGDHSYSVGRAFLLWDSRQHTGQSISFCVVWNRKLKMEEKRQIGKRALDLYPNGYNILWAHFHLLIRKSRTFPWGQLSDKPEIWKETCVCRSSCTIFTLHNPYLCAFDFLFLSLFFPNVLLYSLSRTYSKLQPHDSRKNRDLFPGFNVCNIIIYSRAGRGYRDGHMPSFTGTVLCPGAIINSSPFHPWKQPGWGQWLS